MDLRDQLQSALGSAYHLERELGGGGMSRVFVATEAALGRTVVIKLLAPELSGAISLDRFKREIRVAATLQHPHIVPVLTAGEADGLPFYSMPFVDGESLRVLLASGPLSIGDTVNVLRDVARALAYAHARGIVHRDIKPDNVLLSGGSAVVTDFGIAKAIAASRSGTFERASGGARAPFTSALTELGTSLGTPAYMAPEQAAADPATDHRADIYAFGCVAYEMLAGRPPFVEPSAQQLLAAQMAGVPQPIRLLRPETPAALAALVMQCLEKSADDRPQSARELSAVLDGVANPRAATGTTLSRALSIYVIAFVAVVLVARLAIGAIGLPEWVFPGSLLVMALGLPVIMLTAYTQRAARHSTTPGSTAATHGTIATLAVRASPHLSWRRTTFGGLYALVAFVLLIGTFMLLRAFGVGSIGSLLASGKLAARDRLVIADFTVTNSDTALGAVVSDAVRAGLAQSSVISLVPAAAVASTVRLMKRDPRDHLDASVAREVAQRQGVKAIVDGSVTGVGASYIVSLRLITADSGLELASFRETGDGPRGLIDAADKLARALRGKVGESLRDVHETPRLAEATTSSLEALKKYSAAVRANNIEGNPFKALALLRETVAIDSTFGSAWRILAISLGNAGAPQSSRDSAIEQSFRYRDRMPEVERLNTVAVYYMNGPHRDRAKRIAAYEAVIQRDPRMSPNNIGTAYKSRREYAAAESVFRAVIRLDSSAAIAYSNVVEAQIDRGDFKGALATLDTIARRFPDNLGLRRGLAFALYDAGRVDDAGRYLDSLHLHGSASEKAAINFLLIRFSFLHGRVSQAHALQRELDRQPTNFSTSVLDDSLSHIDRILWMYGPSDSLVRAIDNALAATPIDRLLLVDRPYLPAASLYARAGRPDKARAILEDRRRDVTDTAMLRLQRPFLQTVLGEIALAEHKPQVALDNFRRADMGDDGYPESECANCPWFDYARAFDLADMRDSAIVAYEKFISTPYYARLTATDGDVLAGVHKRLGELYEASDNPRKAAEHYAQFVELWKNADPDLQPRVADVRKRLARLVSDRSK